MAGDKASEVPAVVKLESFLVLDSQDVSVSMCWGPFWSLDVPKSEEQDCESALTSLSEQRATLRCGYLGSLVLHSQSVSSRDTRASAREKDAAGDGAQCMSVLWLGHLKIKVISLSSRLNPVSSSQKAGHAVFCSIFLRG